MTARRRQPCIPRDLYPAALHTPTTDFPVHLHPSSLSSQNLYPHTTAMAENKTTEYVTLVSNDGYEFKLLRSAACIAGTIKKALDPMCTSHAHLPQPKHLLTSAHSRLSRKHTESRGSAYDQVRCCPAVFVHTEYARHSLSEVDVNKVALCWRKCANTFIIIRSMQRARMFLIWIYRPSCAWSC